jgi:hypothetical protein
MADVTAQLHALKAEQQRLELKHAELLAKRRAEIGKLAERLGLLEADDDVLAGALLELKEASAKTGDERLTRWRAAGTAFRRKDKDAKATASRPGNGLAQPAADATRR